MKRCQEWIIERSQAIGAAAVLVVLGAAIFGVAGAFGRGDSVRGTAHHRAPHGSVHAPRPRVDQTDPRVVQTDTSHRAWRSGGGQPGHDARVELRRVDRSRAVRRTSAPHLGHRFTHEADGVTQGDASGAEAAPTTGVLPTDQTVPTTGTTTTVPPTGTTTTGTTPANGAVPQQGSGGAPQRPGQCGQALSGGEFGQSVVSALVQDLEQQAAAQGENGNVSGQCGNGATASGQGGSGQGHAGQGNSVQGGTGQGGTGQPRTGQCGTPPMTGLGSTMQGPSTGNTRRGAQDQLSGQSQSSSSQSSCSAGSSGSSGTPSTSGGSPGSTSTGPIIPTNPGQGSSPGSGTSPTPGGASPTPGPGTSTAPSPTPPLDSFSSTASRALAGSSPRGSSVNAFGAPGSPGLTLGSGGTPAAAAGTTAPGTLAPATASVGLRGATSATGPGRHAASHSGIAHMLAPPDAATNVIERFVKVVPTGVWIALAASLALAAVGGAAAYGSHRRVRRQAGQFAAISAAALTDPLTGVLNRRGFTESVERELARARRYHRPFVLAYVDVRGLKGVNDTEGHLAGDRLLKGVASLLQESARADDVVGRIGGDELGLLLAEQTASGAEVVTRRIQAKLPEQRAAIGLSAPLDLTIGTAAFPEDGETFDELLAAADRRLYEQRGISLR